jgi:hypothetical protein
MAEEMGIKFIDFNDYFIEMKSSAQYPLFPKYGTHWSVYGMSFVADSLMEYIKKLKGEDLREVRVVGYEVSDVPRDTDNDVEKPLNLICSLPPQELAYPVWAMDTIGDLYRPMVLSVADSYYWNIFNTRIPKYVFANEAFWYFNARVYPETYYHETLVKDLDLKDELEKQDIILLMVTERFMHKFDWQFIDMAYNLYVPGWLKDPVYQNMNRVVNNDRRFVDLIGKTEADIITLEEVLRDEAMYLYYKENMPLYLIEHGVEHFKKSIRRDDAWYRHIAEKAAEKKMDAEEQLRIDAEYVFNQNHPELYLIHQGIRDMIEELESDPDQLEILTDEAKYYCWKIEDYLTRKAFFLYREKEIQKTKTAILNSPGWLADVKAKAFEKGVPLDTMLRRDAEYVWEQRLK